MTGQTPFDILTPVTSKEQGCNGSRLKWIKHLSSVKQLPDCDFILGNTNSLKYAQHLYWSLGLGRDTFFRDFLKVWFTKLYTNLQITLFRLMKSYSWGGECSLDLIISIINTTKIGMFGFICVPQIFLNQSYVAVKNKSVLTNGSCMRPIISMIDELFNQMTQN